MWKCASFQSTQVNQSPGRSKPSKTACVRIQNLYDPRCLFKARRSRIGQIPVLPIWEQGIASNRSCTGFPLEVTRRALFSNSAEIYSWRICAAFPQARVKAIPKNRGGQWQTGACIPCFLSWATKPMPHTFSTSFSLQKERLSLPLLPLDATLPLVDGQHGTPQAAQCGHPVVAKCLYGLSQCWCRGTYFQCFSRLFLVFVYIFVYNSQAYCPWKL